MANEVAKYKKMPVMHMRSEDQAHGSHELRDAEIDYEHHFTVEHQDVIRFADNEFGAKCWCHSITHQVIDFVDFKDGKYSVGVAAFVKVVQLASGVFHEELGYGMCCGLGSKSLSIANARKESALNALKNAIQSFGGSSLNVRKLTTPPKVRKKSYAINLTHTENLLHKQTHPSDSDDASPVMPNKAAVSSKVLSSVFDVASHTPQKNTNEFQDEDKCKLERKRKQRQKQEEFKQHFKRNQLESLNSPQFNLNEQNKNPNEWNKVDEMIQTLDDIETDFISTQELDNMVQMASVTSKSTGPQHRVPLLSSPPKRNTVHEWRIGNDNPSRRLDMNKLLKK